MSDPQQETPRDSSRARRSAATTTPSSNDTTQQTPVDQTTETTVEPRRLQYIIGQRSTANVFLMGVTRAPAYDANKIKDAIDEMRGVDFVRQIKGSTLSVFSASPSASEDIVVALAATPEDALHLETMATRNPSLIVERDELLHHLGIFRPQFFSPARNPTQITATSTPVRFLVHDSNGAPIGSADIIVYGSTGSEDQGKTNAQGAATIPVTAPFLNQVAALYVKPPANYWEQFLERPRLDPQGVNMITLQPLSSYARAGYPGQAGSPFIGWGQEIMGLRNLVPLQSSGENANREKIRVAIIDSGCDVTHPALDHIRIGRDYTNLTNNQPDEETWKNDPLSHGTHCAGIIAGNGKPGHICGFVPKAEVHILKLFPGGAFNNLVAAINYCVSEQIHVVNCSLGGDARSQLVTQVFERARQAGVAVFVAAGNSSDTVKFPANLPGVLCVSAIGQAGNVPVDTYHARTVPDGATLVDQELFPARFSCHGPEVGVCAPGVGVISSVPGGYAASDGTSMADPHVAGVGAFLAAHHPALGGDAVRDATWVDHLFQLVRDTAVAVGLTQDRGGVGLPILPTSLTQRPAGQPSPANQQAAPAPSTQTRQIKSTTIAEIVAEVIKRLPPNIDLV